MIVKRGDLVTVAVSGDYGKPRPALIIQADDFDSIPSITIAPLTSDIYDAPLIRISVQPSAGSGLRRLSQVMVDKITTIPRSKLGERIGSLDSRTLRAVNHAITGFLDLGQL